MLKNALMMTAGIIIGEGAISVLDAQSGAPYYLVAAINVKDKTAYEASSVDKVRDGMMKAAPTAWPCSPRSAAPRPWSVGWPPILSA